MRSRLPTALLGLAVLLAAPAPLVAVRAAPAVQATPAPAGTPLSEPVRAGDWTFQLLDVERRDDYYAERLGQVFRPRGIFLIVGLAITYVGTSPNVGDRFLPGSLWFEVTAADGTVYPQSQEAYAAFAVEESYRQDTPYPPLPSGGVAEPGITYYQRYIFDVPADATGLTLTSHPAAPSPFAFPIPDPAASAGPRLWELTVIRTELRETLEPPLTQDRYEADGVYIVVHVRLAKLTADPAAFGIGWFALRTDGGEPVEPAVEETFAMGAPSVTDAPQTWEFALVFDLPPGHDEGLTLVSTSGSPIEVEEALTPVAVTTVSPTRTPTATPTVAPTTTPTHTPTVTASAAPTRAPTATATATPTAAPTATSTATATPTPVPTATPTAPPMPTVPPAPGSIQVVAPEGGPVEGPAVVLAAGAAVELILDTSGSMLQPLGDQLRIDVAKAALTDLVTTTLPPGTPLALRVFGTEPDSCETTLAVPFAPLDPAAVAARIAAIEAVNLVRTPIGAALEAVATDLADAGEPRIVVLVTDGEETCGGDPRAAIAALVASGIDVRVNIVGFALDDEALKRQFREWARLGNGRYIDAGDADELSVAVAAAVQPPFRVLDQSGAVVAEGVVGGDPVPVPPGTYSVEVLSAPARRFDDIVVAPGADVQLTLDTA